MNLLYFNKAQGAKSPMAKALGADFIYQNGDPKMKKLVCILLAALISNRLYSIVCADISGVYSYFIYSRLGRFEGESVIKMNVGNERAGYSRFFETVYRFHAQK